MTSYVPYYYRFFLATHFVLKERVTQAKFDLQYLISIVKEQSDMESNLSSELPGLRQARILLHH